MNRIVNTILVSFILALGSTAWAQSVSTDETALQLAQKELERFKIDLQQLAQNNAPAIRIPQPSPSSIIPINVPNVSISHGNVRIFTQSDTPLSSLQVAPGTWWSKSENAEALGLTKEQQKKMDDIFQQNRLKLIDLNASLSKEEAILDPLIAAEKLDEVKILGQIDRIALARAELEKANSRMLLAIRQSLTMEQWTKLQANPRLIRR